MDPSLYTSWPPQAVPEPAIQHEPRVDDWSKDRAAPSGGVGSPLTSTTGLDIADFGLTDIAVSGSPPSASSLGLSSASFFPYQHASYFHSGYPTMPYGSSWPPLSNYSSLNGATTSTTPAVSSASSTSVQPQQSQSQPQPQPQSQPQPAPTPQEQSMNLSSQAQPSPPPTPSTTTQMVIDPALTTLNGTRSVNLQHYSTSNYNAQSQSQSQPLNQYPYSYLSSLYRASAPYYQHLQPQTTQGTLSPQALHSPSSSMLSTIPPQSFYSTLTPTTIIPATQKPSTPVTPTEPELTPEERAWLLQTSVKPLLAANQFTGAGAVYNLVSKLTEFGAQDVDPPTRLEILTKIRDGAGNHYFRAWSENSTAVEITRDWLKAAFFADPDSPLVETVMPLLHIIDRLPMTVESLKASKLGKLVVKLVKDPPSPAIKDMASNIERKWRTLVDRAEGPTAKTTDSNPTEDLNSKKRKLSDNALSSNKAIPPTKRLALGPNGSRSGKLNVVVKKEPVKPTAPPKSDSSFFSAPKPKPKLPSFKKAPPAPVPPPTATTGTAAAATAKQQTANVAQPSSIDPFQEVLKSMAKARKGSPAVSTPPSTTTPVQPLSTVTKNGLKKKTVSWPPDDKLESIRLIEKAVYDDDPVDGLHISHSLRDLDRGEGAALHAHIFEETLDWSDPLLFEIPIDIEVRPRGEGSEEKKKQEQREQTALGALYMSPAHIPDSPAEPAHVINEEETDREMQTMICGSEADAVFWSSGVVTTAQSVADLVSQLATGNMALDPALGGASFNAQGLDLSAVGLDSNPTVSAIQALPQEQIQQLLQQLANPGMFPQMDTQPTSSSSSTYGTGDQSMWPGYSGEHNGSLPLPPTTYFHDEPPERGWKGRGRGRGRGRGGEFRPHNKSKTCSFFLAGRCKYGDQCDYSHDYGS